MKDVTQIISDAVAGQKKASEELLPILYAELRRLAGHQMRQKTFGDTFQATELVHEAFLRLVDVSHQQSWDSRGHFFAAAAEAMRRILVERARKKGRLKNGGEWKRISLPDIEANSAKSPVDLLALDEALNRLGTEYPKQAQFVKLRYFAGLTVEEAGRAMNVSRATASRYWTFSKAWLFEAVEGVSDNAAESTSQ